MRVKSVLLAVLVLCAAGFAQNVRYSAPFPSVSSTTSTPYLVANVPPNSPVLSVCSSPANDTPCTNYATTYTSLGVACANGSQDTPDPQPSACQSTGDEVGNIGFWAPAGTYDYTVCVANTCFGPYTVTLGAVSSSPITVQTNGVNNASQTNLNFVTSSANIIGLSITPSNPSTGTERFEAAVSSQQLALNAIMPAPTRAGDVSYYNGTNWIALAGNNSGSNCFGENSSGVPSWQACSVSGVTGSGTTNIIPIWTGASALGNTTTITYSAGPPKSFTFGQDVIIDRVTAATTGVIANSRTMDLTGDWDVSGSETVTVDSVLNITQNSQNFGAGTSVPSAYSIWVKSPTYTGSPVTHAGIRIEDQGVSYPSSGIAGRQVNGILVAAQTGATQPLGDYGINSKGPNNWGQYTNFSQSKTLASGVATAFATVQSQNQNSGQTSNWIVGGQVRYCVFVTLSPTTTTPDFQTDCGVFGYAGYNKHGTVASNLSAVTSEATNVTTGTLTVAFSAVNNAGDPGSVSLKCNATSSIGSSVLTIYYDISSYGSDTWGQAVLPQ